MALFYCDKPKVVGYPNFVRWPIHTLYVLGNEALAWCCQRLIGHPFSPGLCLSLLSQYLSLWQVDGWTTLSLAPSLPLSAVF